jgi:D-arabinose 1-dehydrogenase-like Zn-dependent alcohol dehydrogenase
LEARDYPRPEPQGEEVSLRAEAAGVCHGDARIRDGHFDPRSRRSLMRNPTTR